MLRLLKAWLPVTLWAALILSFANDEFSDTNTQGWLDRILGGVPELVNAILRKAGHIAGYAILGLLAWRARRSIVVAMCIAIAVATIDETMQSMTLAREGSPYDVLLDTCGALLALLFVPDVRRRLSR